MTGASAPPVISALSSGREKGARHTMKALWLALLLVACKGSTPAPVAPADAARARSVDVAPARPAAVADPHFHDDAELAALGARIVALENGESLVCPGAGDANCICRQSLPCEATKNCMVFDGNVQVFRKTLKKPGKGRTLTCDRAEIGKCGAYRYFNFDGDIGRHERRWFDDTGRLVAQRNSSDHDAYCKGRARKMLYGRIPRCETMVSDELICGKAEGPLPTIMDELLQRPPKK